MRRPTGNTPNPVQSIRNTSERRGPQQATTERRRFLLLGITSAAATLSGCDFLDYYFHSSPTESTPTTATAPNPVASAPGPAADPTPLTWLPNPTFVQGSPEPFDLAATLPPGVTRGGVFSIDPAGSPLPAGVTMTSSGLLYAGTASVGTTPGVVFRYVEPS